MFKNSDFSNKNLPFLKNSQIGKNLGYFGFCRTLRLSFGDNIVEQPKEVSNELKFFNKVRQYFLNAFLNWKKNTRDFSNWLLWLSFRGKIAG